MMREEDGLLKILVSPEDRRLLGVHVIGAQATDLVHIGQALMDREGGLDFLLSAVFNYPTLAEAYKVAGLDAMNRINLGAERAVWRQTTLKDGLTTVGAGLTSLKTQRSADSPGDWIAATEAVKVAGVAWVEEADGVFRGGAEGARHRRCPARVRRRPEVPDPEVGQRGRCERGRNHGLLPRGEGRRRRAGHRAGAQRDAVPAKFEDYPPGGRIVGGLPNLFRKHGMAHGKVFRQWLDDQLDHKTFAAVKAPNGTDSRLKVAVAVDVTNSQLLVLPDDLPRYRLPRVEDGDRPGRVPDLERRADEHVDPYFFFSVLLVRDQVRCTGRGGTDLLDGALVDRLDVEQANAGQTSPCTFEEIDDPPPAVIVDGGEPFERTSRCGSSTSIPTRAPRARSGSRSASRSRAGAPGTRCSTGCRGPRSSRPRSYAPRWAASRRGSPFQPLQASRRRQHPRREAGVPEELGGAGRGRHAHDLHVQRVRQRAWVHLEQRVAVAARGIDAVVLEQRLVEGDRQVTAERRDAAHR